MLAVQFKKTAQLKKAASEPLVGGSGRTRIIPIPKEVAAISDVVALALVEVRREHSSIGNYNLVVGDLVMK